MKPSLFKLTLTLMIYSVAGALSAQTLAEKEAWAREDQALEKSVASVESACGAKVALTVDKPSWWKVRDEWKNGSPAGRCGLVYDALHNVCSSAEGKKAVAAKVKSVRCAYGGANSGHKLELKGGVMQYTVQLDKPNQGEALIKFLKESI